MYFVYLHGFNSAYNPDSDKSKYLATLGDVTGITYNSFNTYEEIYNEISSKVVLRDDMVFVGTSLGGFWASQMGKKFHVPSVIINPCVDPSVSLKKYIGKPHVNYLTREKNTLTMNSVNSYHSHSIQNESYTYLPLVLLDMGDEVIDSKETQSDLSNFPMTVYQNGSHRFDHIESALEDISSYVNRCNFVDQLNV